MNELLMLSMIISLILCIILLLLLVQTDMDDDVIDIKMIFDNKDLTNKINNALYVCVCLFPTLTIIIYNFFTK